MKVMGGEYVERTLVLRRDGAKAAETAPGSRAVRLDPEQWKEWTGDLSRRFGTTPKRSRCGG